MFPRRILMVLLAMGVFFGYGSAIASARWHMRHHGGGCEGRWSEGRWGQRWDRGEPAADVKVAPQPAQPQTVVVQPPAPAATPSAPAPQVFVISVPATQAPAAAPAPQVIMVPATAAPAPAPAPAATPAQP